MIQPCLACRAFGGGAAGGLVIAFDGDDFRAQVGDGMHLRLGHIAIDEDHRMRARELGAERDRPAMIARGGGGEDIRPLGAARPEKISSTVTAAHGGAKGFRRKFRHRKGAAQALEAALLSRARSSFRQNFAKAQRLGQSGKRHQRRGRETRQMRELGDELGGGVMGIADGVGMDAGGGGIEIDEVHAIIAGLNSKNSGATTSAWRR